MYSQQSLSLMLLHFQLQSLLQNQVQQYSFYLLLHRHLLPQHWCPLHLLLYLEQQLNHHNQSLHRQVMKDQFFRLYYKRLLSHLLQNLYQLQYLILCLLSHSRLERQNYLRQLQIQYQQQQLVLQSLQPQYLLYQLECHLLLHQSPQSLYLLLEQMHHQQMNLRHQLVITHPPLQHVLQLIQHKHRYQLRYRQQIWFQYRQQWHCFQRQLQFDLQPQNLILLQSHQNPQQSLLLYLLERMDQLQRLNQLLLQYKNLHQLIEHLQQSNLNQLQAHDPGLIRYLYRQKWYLSSSLLRFYQSQQNVGGSHLHFDLPQSLHDQQVDLLHCLLQYSPHRQYQDLLQPSLFVMQPMNQSQHQQARSI